MAVVGRDGMRILQDPTKNQKDVQQMNLPRKRCPTPRPIPAAFLTQRLGGRQGRRAAAQQGEDAAVGALPLGHGLQHLSHLFQSRGQKRPTAIRENGKN